MLYSKAELTAVYDICRAYGLPLFIDGARLGYGLVCDSNDVTLPELARLCDVFYIGGTKVGALFGEAVVIMNPALKKDFRFMMKQRGGMLAKGRLLGIQFDTLFTDDLYFKIARNAIDKAFQIRDIFVSNGYPLLFDSPTNQQYPSSLMMSWLFWARSSAMSTGRGWTPPIPAFASAEAGPPRRRMWTRCAPQ